jgi:hypothetical protein
MASRRCRSPLHDDCESLMKRKFLVSMLVSAAAVLAAPVAHAQQDDRRGPHRRGDQRMMPLPRQDGAMPPPMMQGGAQPRGRMSPEERRQLRRDIDAAGRELYPPPPPQPQR